MKQNQNNKQNIEDIPADVLSHISNTLVSENPDDFMPHLMGLERKSHICLLELVHRGKVSASYQAYGFILIRALSNSTEDALELFSNGLNWLQEQRRLEEEKNNDTK